MGYSSGSWQKRKKGKNVKSFKLSSRMMMLTRRFVKKEDLGAPQMGSTKDEG